MTPYAQETYPVCNLPILQQKKYQVKVALEMFSIKYFKYKNIYYLRM